MSMKRLIGTANAVMSSKVGRVAMGAGALALAVLPSLADDTVLTDATTLQTQFADGVYPYVNNIVPIALALFGLAIGVSLLMHWGKKATH